MVEEEGSVMGGLLVGLNVIDANLCIKGEDLDSQVSGFCRPARPSSHVPFSLVAQCFFPPCLGGGHRLLPVSEGPSQQRDSERVSARCVMDRASH